MIQVEQFIVNDKGEPCKDDQAGKLSYVMRSQGENVAALSMNSLDGRGLRICQITMNKVWVSQDIFQAIMKKVQEALVELQK